PGLQSPTRQCWLATRTPSPLALPIVAGSSGCTARRHDDPPLRTNLDQPPTLNYQLSLLVKMFLNPPGHLTKMRAAIGAVACLLLLSSLRVACAVDGISSNAMQQISALLAEKTTRTAAQLKMEAPILYAIKISRGQPVVTGINSLQ